mgnify:CR=1 FL=1
MESFIKFADTLSTSMGKAFSWCIVILMGGTVYEVVMAYAFNKPTLWNFDFSMQMYGAILMMSGAYCLATEAHVRGDVIYRLFKEKTQAWIDLVKDTKSFRCFSVIMMIEKICKNINYFIIIFFLICNHI